MEPSNDNADLSCDLGLNQELVPPKKDNIIKQLRKTDYSKKGTVMRVDAILKRQGTAEIKLMINKDIINHTRSYIN